MNGPQPIGGPSFYELIKLRKNKQLPLSEKCNQLVRITSNSMKELCNEPPDSFTQYMTDWTINAQRISNGYPDEYPKLEAEAVVAITVIDYYNLVHTYHDAADDIVHNLNNAVPSFRKQCVEQCMHEIDKIRSIKFDWVIPRTPEAVNIFLRTSSDSYQIFLNTIKKINILWDKDIAADADEQE